MPTRPAEPIDTPWRVGRFDERRGAPRLLFGRTFEDPAIEDALFPADGTVVCIAAAGDTARALAASGRRVIAVDINPAQIDEVRHRLAGRAPRHGSADRLLAIGRAALVPLGWRPARLRRFCLLDDPVEQAAEWRRLTSPLVRASVRAALGPHVLRVAYGESFSRLAPQRFGELLVDRIGRRITTAPNRANPWLAALLTGEWTGDEPVHRTGAIDLRGGDVAEVLDAQPAHSLDGISLSNIVDGPSAAYTDRLLHAAQRAARPGAAIVVRTFLEPESTEAARRADLDRSMLWGGITVHRA